MRIPISIFLSLFALSYVRADEPVSINDFKKLDIGSQQKKIEEAPPERKAELQKIYVHGLALRLYRSEKALKMAKEAAIAIARAHYGIVRLFDLECDLLYARVGKVIDDEEKTPGITRKERDAREAAAFKRYDEARARRDSALSLIFETAETPEALTLGKRSREMSEQYPAGHLSQGDIGLGIGKDVLRAVSEDELTDLNRKTDNFLVELRKLPKLPHERLQKEYDAFPEEALLSSK